GRRRSVGDRLPDQLLPQVASTPRRSQRPKPLAITVSPIMTSDRAINSVNTGVAAACTSLALWAANAASSAYTSVVQNIRGSSWLPMLKLTIVPVIPLALSEAMKTATLAISASVESRRVWVLFASNSWNWSQLTPDALA